MNSFYKELTTILENEIKGFKQTTHVFEAGRVVACSDNVIRIEGLKEVKSNEIIYLGEGRFALALNLEANSVGAIIINGDDVSTGTICYSTGRIVNVPVGEELLGRVINSIGEVLDNGPEINTKQYRDVEFPAPKIPDRDKVNEPLYTGIKAIDCMIPIGKGQRELIIGDRQTGKTTIATDTILNQKGKNVICVYVAIGQKASTVSRIIKKLSENDALSYTCVVAATAGESASLQYLAPYAGCAIAEYFMYQGKDVLICYDDLSKHAIAYRTISLLLRRPSGREAYPGDIFYLHSRLLERSAHLSEALGGGSITALPIVETLAGDISAYIPTNVISITDGQIYLEKELFNEGIRPAINVGLSVSRVGGSAQVKAIRKIAGHTRLDLAHFREMVVFARFGSDLDYKTMQVIDKGERLTEVLKQEQDAPKSMFETFISIYIAMNDYLVNVAVKDVKKFVEDFISYIKSNGKDLIDNINNNLDYTEEDEERIKELFDDFRKFR
ncbi:MAG: F0F1 ATP synthase subunit alpha [Clostridia bacterium]|nr:F0F1 ATP synthase subunit alpha [Clostridia bacterium]